MNSSMAVNSRVRLLLVALVVLLLSPISAICQEKDHLLVGPTKVPLGKDIASINLPKGYVFIKEDVAKQILEEQGNSAEGVLGLVLPASAMDEKNENGPSFFVVCRFEDIGYVKDDDAEKLDAKEILKSYQEGAKEQNEELKKHGIPPIYVSGWAEDPHYVKDSHQVIWGIAAKNDEKENTPATLINYNTRILGRKGVLSMNLVTDPDALTADKKQVKEVLNNTAFVEGNKYEDFRKGDKESGFGIGGLILGGGALAVAAKTGLLGVIGKWLIAAVLICKKFIIVIGIAAFAAVKALFGRGKKTEEDVITETQP